VLTFVIRRIAAAIPVLLLASVLLFVFVRATQNPLGRVAQNADPNARTRRALQIKIQEKPCVDLEGRTRDGAPIIKCRPVPIMTQYARYMKGALHGRLGDSEVTGHAVTEDLRLAMGNTIQLIFWGVLISAAIAIGIGVFSAVRQYSVPDYILTGLSFAALAMPPFWFGLMLIHFLVFRLKDFAGWDQSLFLSIGLHSAGGGVTDYFRHLALPVATLCVQIIASWSRYQRSTMLDVMSSDYIRTAKAKGLSRARVVLKHGLRNSLIPLVTVMAIDIGALFGGLLITEQIFAIPGMGRLFIDSLLNGDTSVLLPWLMISAIFIILFNLIADILYGVLDPRIRLG